MPALHRVFLTVSVLKHAKLVPITEVSVGREEASSLRIRSQSFGGRVLLDCELHQRFCFSFLPVGGIGLLEGAGVAHFSYPNEQAIADWSWVFLLPQVG